MLKEPNKEENKNHIEWVENVNIFHEDSITIVWLVFYRKFLDEEVTVKKKKFLTKGINCKLRKLNQMIHKT